MIAIITITINDKIKIYFNYYDLTIFSTLKMFFYEMPVGYMAEEHSFGQL